MIRTRSGYTLVEIMIVVSIIGLLALIVVPRFVRARVAAQKNTCVNNLRQIDSAKTLHALENAKRSGDNVDGGELDPYLRGKFEAMEEPAEGDY